MNSSYHYSTKQNKGDNMKIRKVRIIFSFIFVMVFLLSACSANYPFEKGFTEEKSIDFNKDTKLGDLNKAGWELVLSENSLETDQKIQFTVLSSSESEEYTSQDFEFLGTPIKIKLENQENIRLEKPVTITIKFPEEQLTDLLQEELFFAYFYENQWEYYTPEQIDLDKRTAQFTIYHFSDLGFGRPSQEKQIETYAKNMAVNVWQNESEKNAYVLATSKQFDDLFDSMGVQSRTARNQLMADIISYVDETDVGYFDYIAQSANAASKGSDGKLDFENKWKEFVGKALYQSLNKDPSGFAGKANIIGNLASAAGSIAGGDSKAALQSIANMLNGAVPLSQLVASTTAYVAAKANQAIDYWAASEIEKAYQVYATGVGGKYGYEDGLKGDFETIFILLGGGQRQFEIRIIEQYCKKMQDDACNLSDAKKAEIINNAKTALKNSFDNRIISDPAIKKIQNEEMSFITALKNQYLLNASNYQKYFGIDKNGRNYNVNDRLDRLYKIRTTVLGLMDKNIRDSISDEMLAKAIDQWIYWNEQGDREGFMKYLKEMGYIIEPLVLIPSIDGYWSLETTRILEAKLNENTTGSIGSGSANISMTSKSTGDTFAAIMNWTAPGSKYHAGDPIEISISASITGYQWNGKNDGYLHLGLNYVGAQISARIDVSEIAHGYGTGGSISFMNEDKEYMARVSTNYGKIDVESMTLDVLGAFRAGSKNGDIKSIYVSTSAGSVEYVYRWHQ